MFSSPAKASLNLIRDTDTSKFSGSGKSFFQITPGKYLLFIYQTFLLNEKTNNWKIKSINLFQISTKYYFYMCSAKFENNLLWILHRTSNTLKANYLKFSEMNKKFLNLFLRGVWKFINQRDFFYFWVFWICKGWTLKGFIHPHNNKTTPLLKYISSVFGGCKNFGAPQTPLFKRINFWCCEYWCKKYDITKKISQWEAVIDQW